MATLREFQQLSYIATVMGDAWGYTQRSPDQQIIPDHLLKAVKDVEFELRKLPDSDLEELGNPSAETTRWEELEASLKPGVIDVVDHIFQDELHAVVFLTPDDEAEQPEAEAA